MKGSSVDPVLGLYPNNDHQFEFSLKIFSIINFKAPWDCSNVQIGQNNHGYRYIYIYKGFQLKLNITIFTKDEFLNL